MLINKLVRACAYIIVIANITMMIYGQVITSARAAAPFVTSQWDCASTLNAFKVTKDGRS